jgi:hypothetical protein
MPQTSTQIQILKPVQDFISSIPAPLKSPAGILLMTVLLGWAVISTLGKSTSKRSATGRFSQGKEQTNAKRQAKQQIRSSAPNSVRVLFLKRRFKSRSNLLANLLHCEHKLTPSSNSPPLNTTNWLILCELQANQPLLPLLPTSSAKLKASPTQE